MNENFYEPKKKRSKEKNLFKKKHSEKEKKGRG